VPASFLVTRENFAQGFALTEFGDIFGEEGGPHTD
jgi:hypothetical protein